MTRRSAVPRLVPPAAALLVVSLLSIAARPAAAQVPVGQNAYAKIVVHIVPENAAGKDACTSGKGLVGCNDMVTQGDLNVGYYAYLCVTDGDRAGGIAGLQCGVRFNGGSKQGVDVYEWKLCATMDFKYSPWPQSGGSNLITWDFMNSCQREVPDPTGGVVAVAGYFYLTAYGPDRFEVIPRPVDGIAKVAACDTELNGEIYHGAENDVEGGSAHFISSHLGYVSFSAGAKDMGYNPCGTNRPVEDATWSRVKSRDQ